MKSGKTPRLFNSAIIGNGPQALDFITHLLQASTEYSIIGLGLDGAILLWNEGARRLYGYAPEEVIGKANAAMLHTPEAVQAGKPGEIRAAALQAGRWTGVVTCIRKNGQRFPTRAAITPRYDDQSRALGFLLISTDISAEIDLREALAGAQRRWQSLFQNTQDALLFVDDEARFVDVNPAACALLGYDREELLQLTIMDITPASEGEFVWQAWQSFKVEGRRSGEFTVLRKDDTKADVEFRAVANISPNLHLSVLHDISQRKQAEKIGRESAELYHSLIEASPDGIVLGDLEANLIMINQQTLNLFGYARAEEMIGLSGFDLVAPEDRAQTRQDLQQTFETGSIRNSQYTLLRKDGSRFPAEVSIALVRNLEGQPQSLTAIFRDITERKRAQELTMKQRQELRRLSIQLINTQEAERKRLAHELHDEMGQALTAIGLNLEVLEQEVAQSFPPALSSRLADTISLVDQILTQTHELSLNLRPTMLDDLGLEATLSWYVKRFAARSNITVKLDTDDFGERLEPDVEIALYRVVQEALTNVARHAQAQRVYLRLAWLDGAMTVLIEDNGRGFDVDALKNRQTAEPGLGLIGMRERVMALSGRLDIQSQPGQGTRLFAHIPV